MKQFSLFVGRLLVAGLLVAAFTKPAVADLSGPLKSAMVKTQAQHSYHITMVDAKSATIEGDVVNPGRYHMTMPQGEMIIVGDAMYMKMSANGSWTKTPGAAALWQNQDVLHSYAAATQITTSDLGMRVVDGVPMHAYSITNAQHHTTDTAFIDGQGRIARIEAAKMVMTFSRWNEDVTINPPM